MDGAGPFIPQSMYKPHTTSDRKRYVEEVLLEAPLFFYLDQPTQCGILLKDALQSRTKKLRNRDQVVFEGRGPSVSIRLEVSTTSPSGFCSQLSLSLSSGLGTDDGVGRSLPRTSVVLPDPSPSPNWPRTLPNVCNVS